MNRCGEQQERITAGAYDASLKLLCPSKTLEQARERLSCSARSFASLYGDRPIRFVSAPGRTEIGGNHTDHQRGRVLAAAVDLDTLCAASPNNERVIRIQSEGHEADEISLDQLEPLPAEQGRAAALIRGVASWFAGHGYRLGGFDAYTTTEVLSGSGLSSSAAFEVAVGNILKTFYAPEVTATELAIAGQYAENRFFGKPCGLMDQMASSLGGMNMIDFGDPAKPAVTAVACDFAAMGLRLCITDTKGSHADLTPEYAAIPEEMSSVARCFGKEVLRQVDKDSFCKQIPSLRLTVGDRAILRAMHFFAEDERVLLQAKAAAFGDRAGFLKLIRESGASSLSCLQNVFVPADPKHQALALALALSGQLLGDKGAWRVHGGGFAGTIQAFVPEELLETYCARMDAVFGAGACKALTIRPVGGVCLEAAAHG